MFMVMFLTSEHCFLTIINVLSSLLSCGPIIKSTAWTNLLTWRKGWIILRHHGSRWALCSCFEKRFKTFAGGPRKTSWCDDVHDRPSCRDNGKERLGRWLQTNLVRPRKKGGLLYPTFQCFHLGEPWHDTSRPMKNVLWRGRPYSLMLFNILFLDSHVFCSE